jgi:hypothetical protein
MFNFDIAAARPPAVTSPHPPAVPPGYRNARPPAVKAIAAGLPTVALGSGDHPIAATEEETNQRLLMFQEVSIRFPRSLYIFTPMISSLLPEPFFKETFILRKYSIELFAKIPSGDWN